MGDTERNADWLPRDENGQFKAGFQVCRECDGTGRVKELGDVRDDFDGDVPDFGDLEVIEVDCRRCNGRGAEHAEGCPTCGSEVHDQGVMPCSGISMACYDCGWNEVVG